MFGSTGRAGARPGRIRFQRRHAIALGVAVAAWLLTSWPVLGLAFGAMVLLVPNLFLRRSETQIRNERLASLAAWTRRLADLMRSGGVTSLRDALVRTADTAPVLIRPQAQRLASRIGPQGADPALRAFADELADPISDEIVMALLIRERQGGSGLPHLLDQLAETVDNQIENERVVDAERHRQVVVVRMLLIIAAAMWIGMKWVVGSLLSFYDSPSGQMILGLILSVFVGAVVWVQHALDPAPRHRLLGKEVEAKPS
ncbi:hypothetical protein M3697_12465 [Janibacter melonis]|uniref:type II secretion system F family protein n=1 Tax=Janibacter melonis TaxID=262209 RepID=UPI0020432585|nr:hypothetical protein [Janibacter melonis]MCM3555910.1 hypothetical protein [Janibacter melonis]